MGQLAETGTQYNSSPIDIEILDIDGIHRMLSRAPSNALSLGLRKLRKRDFNPESFAASLYNHLPREFKDAAYDPPFKYGTQVLSERLGVKVDGLTFMDLGTSNTPLICHYRQEFTSVGNKGKFVSYKYWEIAPVTANGIDYARSLMFMDVQDDWEEPRIYIPADIPKELFDPSLSENRFANIKTFIVLHADNSSLAA